MILVTNDGHQKQPLDIMTSRKKSHPGSDFGQQLAELRTAAGYTQVELANEVGISLRMISYYEGRAEHPPTAVLPDLARALWLCTDKLLGVKPVKRTRPCDPRMARRLQQIEKLEPKGHSIDRRCSRSRTAQAKDEPITTKNLRG